MNKNIKKALIDLAVSLQLTSLFGCAKTVECNIEGNHAHLYTNEDDFTRIIKSEKEKVKGLNRTDYYVTIDPEQEKLIKFENNHGLYRIDYNKDKIDSISNELHDYMEYRYAYTYLMPMVTTSSNGKTTTTHTTYIPMTGYSWTTNPDRSRLTGDTRVIHHVYYGYKIVENKRGKLKVIKSDPVESIDDLPNGFVYVKKHIYDKVLRDDTNTLADYEDGPEESHKLPEGENKESEGIAKSMRK